MTRCLGCGVKLQNKDSENLGYTTDLENKICERCFKLQNYGKYSSVNLNNEDYTKIINSINQDNLVIYTTDILNLSINNINKFKRVIILVTKKDILPKSIKDEKIMSDTYQLEKKYFFHYSPHFFIFMLNYMVHFS